MKKSYLFFYLFTILLYACGGKEHSRREIPEYYDKNDTSRTSETYIVSNIQASLRSIYTLYIAQNQLQRSDRIYSYSAYDLNGDGLNEYMVFLHGNYFRGSGGGTLLLLDSSFEIITEFTVSDIPLYVLNGRTNGWKDLMIYSNGTYHKMMFDGVSYPSNPSVEPDVTKEAEDIDTTLLDSHGEGKMSRKYSF